MKKYSNLQKEILTFYRKCFKFSFKNEVTILYIIYFNCLLSIIYPLFRIYFHILETSLEVI